jgi:hypothetical protein
VTTLPPVPWAIIALRACLEQRKTGVRSVVIA